MTENPHPRSSYKYKIVIYAAVVVATLIYTFLLIYLSRTQITVPSEAINAATVILFFIFIALVVAYTLRWLSIQRSSTAKVRIGLSELYTRLKATEQMLRDTERMLAVQTHTFIVHDSIKEITILNAEGDADVEYSFTCKNNPDKELTKIRLSISHDGNLEEDSIECIVNNEKVSPTNVRRLITIDEKTGKPEEPLPRSLKLLITPGKPIEPDATFTYQYAYRIRRLFACVRTPLKEFTSTSIIHPTHHLKYVIKAPKDYIFDMADVKIDVIDRDDIEYVAEERRMLEECRPIIIDKGRILLWDIVMPHLANLYRIWFAIRKKGR
jgi:hypothetical protein